MPLLCANVSAPRSPDAIGTGPLLPRPKNYRHVKKQKEEARKARQAEKQQRRQPRTDEVAIEGADAPSPTDDPSIPKP
jgi:hypothetical protein